MRVARVRVAAVARTVVVAVALGACSTEPDFSQDTVKGTWTLVSIDGQAPPTGGVESGELVLIGCGNCSALVTMLRDGAVTERYALTLVWSVDADGALGVFLDVPGADARTPGVVTDTDLTLTVTDIDRLPNGTWRFVRAP